jgi:dicarboxylate/amino acid:cation (Na+ or H+) symporter, DAACS family
MTEKPGRGLPLHTKILLGLVLGAVCGVAVNLNREALDAALTRLAGEPASAVAALTGVTRPVGQVFLNLLLMTVVPLVFASLALGVAQLGDLRDLGRVGAKTLAYFVFTTAVAVVIGLALVNLVQPGAGLPAETRERLLEQYRGEVTEKKAGSPSFGVHTFVNIVPRNPLRAAVEMDMLAVIFFALLIGIGLTAIPPERARAVVAVLEGLSDLMVFIIGVAMRLAPLGVFALIFTSTAQFGFGLLGQLGLYVAVVLAGLALHMFGVFPVLVATLGRLSPLAFFRRVRNVIFTAFSTSSSNATLPTSIKAAVEELGVPPPIARFVLPLGATMNMNGTSLFEGVTVLFLAQVFGVPLGLGDQAAVVVLSVLTAIGAAGVPGGSIPLLMMVLAAVNVPPEGIGIVLGVDRLLDMCRTTLNVTGDLTAAVYVARSEGSDLLKPPAAPPAVGHLPSGAGDQDVTAT